MRVVDERGSESGPQRRKTDPRSYGRERLLHACCICNHVGVWMEGWSSYYSYKDLDEEELVPKFCSPACASKAGRKCENITNEMLEAARQLEMREPVIVYRDPTPDERWNAEVRKQRERSQTLASIRTMRQNGD